MNNQLILCLGLLASVPAFAIGTFPGPAMAFASGSPTHPLNVSLDLNGLQVSTVPGSNTRMAAVRIDNQESRSISCRALFDEGPYGTHMRRVVIEANQFATLGILNGRYSRTRVKISCS